jgi:hypothetical protein
VSSAISGPAAIIVVKQPTNREDLDLSGVGIPGRA